MGKKKVDDPETLGSYRILQRLGEGAAGIVYMATPIEKKGTIEPGSPVAIKAYKPEILRRPNEFERIVREFRVGSEIRHPNVVQVLECSLENELKPYIVMEYVDGMPLTTWGKMYSPIPGSLLLRILRQLANAFVELHGRGILHRDVKPQNIMITPNFAIKLMDLGVVKVSNDPTITPSDEFVGTIRSSSPELLFGEEYDERTDLYSFGVVSYFLLHGHEIFHEEKNFAKLVELVRHGPPTFDASLEGRSDGTSEIVPLTQKLLEKNPASRGVQTASALAMSLDTFRSKYGEPTRPPLHGYVATALTGLDADARQATFFASSVIADCCKEFGIYMWQPRRATDPLLNKDLEPEVVYDLDRDRVVRSDLLVILANSPSIGVGQEIEIAGALGTPTILITGEGTTVSRMVRGSYLHLLDDIVYSSPEDLIRKLKSCLTENYETIKDLRKNFPKSFAPGLGKVLRELREKAGFQLQNAARASRISERLLEAIEEKPAFFHNVGVHVLARLVGLYKITLAELFGGSREVRSSAEATQRNLRTLEKVAEKFDFNFRSFQKAKTDYLQEMAAKAPPVMSEDEAVTRLVQAGGKPLRKR